MREDILKALELLPVWQLRKPLPEAGDVVDKQTVDIETSLNDVAQTVFSTQATHDEQASPIVIAYYNESADFLLVHGQANISQPGKQLFHNIATALGLNRYPISKPQALELVYSAKKPKVMMLMGEALAQQSLALKDDLQALRSKPHGLEGMQVIVTAETDAVLSETVSKATVWQDCCLAMSTLAEAD